ncbi:MAG: cytochrome-c peroxidase [Gammaproteobacteria bacterium]
MFIALAVVALPSHDVVADDDDEDDDDAWFRPPSAFFLAPSDEDFPVTRQSLVELGRNLFFDKELSGNRNISCAGCHSPLIGTSDGLSLNLGEGASGLSTTRDAGTYPPQADAPLERGGRNTPALFNVGAFEFRRLMHDGRFERDPWSPDGLLTPAGDELPPGFETPLEALSVFPFVNHQEMLGQPGENDMADASVASSDGDDDQDIVTTLPFEGVWNIVVARVAAIPEYRQQLLDAYPELDEDLDNLGILHIGRALAHYQTATFRSLNSPFHRYLRGDRRAMSAEARRGFRLFKGRAGCTGCHSGPYLTDHDFHAIGIPQIGPGFDEAGRDGREDFGRENESGDPADRYRFRTPSLINVALTGPWGHDGAYSTLEGVVRHHLQPEHSLRHYDPAQRILPPRADLDARDLVALRNADTTDAIARRIEIRPRRLSSRQFDYLMAFLNALTDPAAFALRNGVPHRVPSGLTLVD